MDTTAKQHRNHLVLLGCFVAIVAVLAFISRSGLMVMEQLWSTKEEYGYGYIIPLVVGFFVWQRKNRLLEEAMTISWAGFAVFIAGVFGVLLGTVSATYSITQFGFVTAFIGAVFQFIGWKAFRHIMGPMLMLFLMIPLPAFLYNNLSSELQLISSKLGVWVIRLFDISVYLEGNVIDLGVYKLQVVEACSGLRYLFPLFSLSVIAAYIYQAPIWKRIFLVLSSIPITILMNSFRVGFIGVLVEYRGIEQAEGFLHDFEGWIIFMACTGLLILEMWVLSNIGKNRQKLSEVFGIDFPEPLSEHHKNNLPNFSTSYLAVSVLALFSAALVMVVGEREEITSDRKTFAEFPNHISDWKGRMDRMESIYLDRLMLDDYILANYSDGKGSDLNFYVAYYGSQQTGETAHSPKACLPGGGWRMGRITQETIAGDKLPGGAVRVNRVLIKKGEYNQLVYYWFQQRGRDITNEYLVKWYLFWDSMTKNRTDGALVRVVAKIPPGGDVSSVEIRLQEFIKSVFPYLGEYIPGSDANN